MRNGLLFVLIAVSIFGKAQASDFSAKLVPGRLITIKVPDSYTVHKTLDTGPVTLYECRTSDKEKFLNIGIELEKKIENSPEAIKAEFLRYINADLSVSPDKKITLVEVRQGADIIGYYYIIRLDSTYPDNMRYMFNGNILVEGMWIDIRSFSSKEFGALDEYLNIAKSISFPPYKQKKYKIEDIRPSKSDFTYSVDVSEKIFCSNDEVKSYYDNPEGAGFGLDPSAKNAQMFETEKEIGTVFYFQYKESAEDGLQYFRVKFNSSGNPAGMLSEDIIVEENMMVVLSFKPESRLKDDVKKIITDKLKSAGK